MTLRSKVEQFFQPQYLFDTTRSAWREMISPSDAEEEGLTSAPWNPLSIVLTFVEVSSASDGNLDMIGAAVSESDVVEVQKTAAGEWQIRRKSLLKPEENPNLRTVFVKPIHGEATDSQIRDFFEPKFGKVERVERNGAKPSVFLVFQTVAAANMAVQSAKNLSYGSCGNALGDLYIPKLQIMMRETHESIAAEEAERLFQQRQRTAVIQAAVDAENASKDAAAKKNAAVEAAGGTASRLRDGVTLKVNGVAAGTLDTDIKLQLGNLCAHFPELKKQVGLVRVVNDTAYVVCKSPQAAQNLAMHYAEATQKKKPLSGCQNLVKVVPTLGLVSGEEEVFCQKHFSEWTEESVKKKLQKNERKGLVHHGPQKRNREDDQQ